MPTRKEIEDQIAELQRQAEEMGDDGEDYEVEIWNADGSGARVPHSQGKNWLAAKFPELFPAAPEAENEGGDDKGRGKRGNNSGGNGGTNPASGSTEVSRTSQRYFGKRPAAGK